MDVYHEVGALIRKIRTERGLTQQELADKLQMTRTSVTNIETGRQHIQLDLLYETARVLEVSVAQLLPPEQPTANPDLPQFVKAVLEKVKCASVVR